MLSILMNDSVKVIISIIIACAIALIVLHLLLQINENKIREIDAKIKILEELKELINEYYSIVDETRNLIHSIYYENNDIVMKKSGISGLEKLFDLVSDLYDALKTNMEIAIKNMDEAMKSLDYTIIRECIDLANAEYERIYKIRDELSSKNA